MATVPVPRSGDGGSGGAAGRGGAADPLLHRCWPAGGSSTTLNRPPPLNPPGLSAAPALNRLQRRAAKQALEASSFLVESTADESHHRPTKARRG